jgi:hypothetical protein
MGVIITYAKVGNQVFCCRSSRRHQDSQKSRRVSFFVPIYCDDDAVTVYVLLCCCVGGFLQCDQNIYHPFIKIICSNKTRGVRDDGETTAADAVSESINESPTDVSGNTIRSCLLYRTSNWLYKSIVHHWFGATRRFAPTTVSIIISLDGGNSKPFFIGQGHFNIGFL